MTPPSPKRSASASASASATTISQQASSLLSQLTLDEKFSLVSGHTLWSLTGIPRLDVPYILVSDGPHGVRKPVKELSLQESFPATCFPPACALACSWDVHTLTTVGIALSKECWHYQISILLGPGMNLKRHPAGGRNFEYFAEDPLLSGRLAAAYVQGVQASHQVGACIKHCCINNQESHRFVVNAVVDERTARELYYRGFEIACQTSHPATLMSAYNQINGVYCSENALLYKQLMRHEFGFTGVCMTDWGATNDRATALSAGMDLEMPGSHGAHHRHLHQCIKQGMLKLKDVDDSCQRLLELILKYKGALYSTAPIDLEAHHKLARHTARQCIVLLQNNDHLLPLAKHTSIALIGHFAGDQPRYQGMGSSQVKAYKVSKVVEEMAHYTDHITYAQGFDAEDDNPELVTHSLIDEAVQVAQTADVVVLCIGLPEIMESEGFDRTTLKLPAQHNTLVKEICKVHANVVIVLSNGGAVELPDYFLNAKAIVEGYLLGQAGAGAMVDILFGEQSPCGKLPETMPVHKQDILADSYFPGTRDTVEHREGLDVGYRYFDSANIQVRFPFGHGLSYTTFEYSHLQLQVETDQDTVKLVRVTFEITNTGSMAGSEVAQCYVRDIESSVYRPIHELKDFVKIHLDPSERKQLTMTLATDAFAFYDIGVSSWVVEAGGFEIQIGSSSRDIRLSETIEFATGTPASDLARESYPPILQRGEVDDDVFAKRFGKDYEKVLYEIRSRSEASSLLSVLVFNRNSLLKELASCRWFGRFLMNIVYKEASREIKPGPSMKRQQRMVRANVENLPLRTLVLFSKGNLSFETVDAIIALMNYRLCSASQLALRSLAAITSDNWNQLMGRR